MFYQIAGKLELLISKYFDYLIGNDLIGREHLLLKLPCFLTLKGKDDNCLWNITALEHSWISQVLVTVIPIFQLLEILIIGIVFVEL